MKTKFTTLGLLLTSIAFAQVTIDKDVVITPGGIFYSATPVTINPTNGLLKVEGNFTVTSEVTGESKLQLEPTATVNLNNGTLTLTHQMDENFTNLTIGAAGIVEVPKGNSLTLSGVLTNNNATNGLRLLADNTGYAQLLTSGSIATKGGTYAEQYFTASANPGWRQFGSPVSATFAQVDDDFQTYYPNAPGTVGTASQWKVKYWEAVSSASGTNPPANGWQNVTSNAWAFGPSSGSVGYTMFVGGAFDILSGGILDLQGEVGHGDYVYFTRPTSATVAQTTENIGWNLIPNPYPSNIDIATLLNDATNFPLAYKAIHIWDGKNQQYVAISDDVNISLSFTGTISGSSAINIAPFQAFWVKGGSVSNQTVTLTNAHRTIVAQGNFFKTAPELIRINAISKNGALDQTIITFESKAEDGLDDRDAFKIISMNDEAHSLYTFADGNKIAINRKSMPEPYKHIPMQFTAPTAGEFTIDMVEETVSPGWMIELEDHKTGTIHNMRNGDYTFTNDLGFTNTRFTVHINKTGATVNNPNTSRLYVYANQESINVVFGYKTTAEKANVLITNLSGQILFNGDVSTESQFVFPVNDDVAMYVVHVLTDQHEIHEKVVVGK
jgi:hypothetical protein